MRCLRSSVAAPQLLLWSCLLAGVVPATTLPGQSIWIGPEGGAWGTAGNWAPQAVPNNSPPDGWATVLIPAGGPTLGAGYNIAGLTNLGVIGIPVGGQLSLTGPSGTVSIENSGTISIAPGSVNFSSAMVFAGETTHTLSGIGTIQLSGVGNARLLGNTNGTLINNGNAIVGEGNFIEGFMHYKNSAGLLMASGGTLNFAPAGCRNESLIAALSGATLNVNGGGGPIDNWGGEITATGGRIRLSNNVRIVGGTLSSSSGGMIETVAAGNSLVTLTEVSNTGHFRVGGAEARLVSHISNSGTISVAGVVSAPSFGTLSSGGTIILEPTSTVRSGLLGNEDNTIVGAGTLGDDSMSFTNHKNGVIRASGGTLTMTTFNDTYNGGLIEANGGTLVLKGGRGYYNSSGVGADGTPGRIHAADNSLVVLTNRANLVAGTLATSGNGTILIPAMQSGALSNVHLDCVIHVDGTLYPIGEGSGQGRVILGSAGQVLTTGWNNHNSDIEMAPGSGIGPDNSGSISVGAPYFINGGEITGAGQVGMNGLLMLNENTIAATEGTPVQPLPLVINPSSDGLINSGVIEARASGIVELNGAGGGAFAQVGGGIIRAADAGSNVRLVNSPTISGGVLGAGVGSISILGNATLDNLTCQATLVQVGISTLSLSGTLTNVGSVSNTNLARIIIGAGARVDGGGLLLNNGSIIVQTGGQLDAGAINGTGRTTVQSNGTLSARSIRQAVLRIDDGGRTWLNPFLPADADPTRVGSLSIGATGAFLDIANRAVIHDYSGGSPLPAIRTHLASGYAGGAWDGPGINSSSAAAHPQHATAVGAIEAADFIAANGTNVFAGETVDPTTVLLRYTWYGDSDFTGVVDFDDYVRIDGGYNGGLTGWLNGDFDYSGAVDFDDYVLIDLGYNSQNGTLRRAQAFLDGSDRSRADMTTPPLVKVLEHFDQFGLDYATHFLSAVPEPGAAALVVAACLGRRSRRSKSRPHYGARFSTVGEV